MNVDELVKEVEQMFACQMGEPRAFTRNPPQPLHLTEETVPEEQRFVYQVFAWQSVGKGFIESDLVNCLFDDFKSMKHLCVSPKPTLLWRRMPTFEQHTHYVKSVYCRLVIPELAREPKLTEWVRLPGHKTEGEIAPTLR